MGMHVSPHSMHLRQITVAVNGRYVDMIYFSKKKNRIK